MSSSGGVPPDELLELELDDELEELLELELDDELEELLELEPDDELEELLELELDDELEELLELELDEELLELELPPSSGGVAVPPHAAKIQVTNTNGKELRIVQPRL